MSEEIDSPLKGVSFCNKWMRRCEEGWEKAKEEGDLLTQAKFAGHLVKWTELLQYYLRQAFQQGDTKKDLAEHIRKPKRFNAKTT